MDKRLVFVAYDYPAVEHHYRGESSLVETEISR